MGEGAGLGRVTVGATVAPTLIVVDDVAHKPTMEAVLSSEGEWPHLDNMEVQYGMSYHDNGGDECMVSGHFD